MTEIRYIRVVNSVAMSKSPHQSGIALSKSGDRIKLQAINPRTDRVTSYLSMEIPVEDIDRVIEELKSLKN